MFKKSLLLITALMVAQFAHAQFGKILSNNKIILTTEKDAVRLEKFQHELQYFPIFVLPVKHEFLFNENVEFDNSLRIFIDSYKKNTTISQSLNN